MDQLISTNKKAEKLNSLSLYKKRLGQKRLTLLITALVSLLVAFYSIKKGAIDLTVDQIIKVFLGQGDSQASLVILNIRLPRALAAILVGAALASSGTVMQCVLQNQLASASTLGVSQGAAFGAALGIVVFGGGIVSSASTNVAMEINNPYIVTLSAFVFGLASTLVILFIARLKKSLGPGSLILAGVALSSLFTGAFTLLQFFADDSQLGAVVFWTFGNLGSASWSNLLVIALVLVFSLGYFMINSWNYNAMSTGTDTAQSLGVDTRRLMLITMTVSSLTAAVSVSFVGIISFIGLVAPHIMRIFLGDDYRFLIPGSALAGALILLLADNLARLLIAPIVLPIGALTSFLGAPVFLYLLIKGASNARN
ncbi:MAG: iron ABC transporter permease [Bacillota bacterium]|nr:iron ABC transporter permease [Bacillota bacterium]